MSYAKVDIANMALAHLGKAEITSLSESTIEARTANFWYDKVCRVAKARSLWTFDRAIRALAEVANDYEERWAHKYERPNDAAKIARMIPRFDPLDRTSAPPIPYQQLGDAVYCNESPAKADILLDGTNPTNWPDDFALAVSYLLARNMAPKLTRKSSYVADTNSLYINTIELAIQNDAGQEPTYYAQDSEYLSARGASPGREGRGADGSTYWD